MDQTCGNCRFFLLQDKGPGSGICRRYPPTVLAGEWVTRKPIVTNAMTPEGTLINQILNIAGQNAPTSRDLWCGEWDELPPKRGETN